jgi:hypothetical protein
MDAGALFCLKIFLSLAAARVNPRPYSEEW